MPARLCRHFKIDGTPCRAVAIAGRPCCLAHQRLHQRTRRLQRILCAPVIRLGSLQDRESIERARLRVTRAIASSSLDLDRAAALFDRIRLADANLGSKEFPERTGP